MWIFYGDNEKGLEGYVPIGSRSSELFNKLPGDGEGMASLFKRAGGLLCCFKRGDEDMCIR